MKNNYIKIFFYFFTLSFFFTACNDRDRDAPENTDANYSVTDSITFKLDQIKVLFPSVEQWEEKGVTTYTKDSVIIYDRNGEMLLGKTFSINVGVTHKLDVELGYETILTIITTGDPIDLTKLKKYTSPWKKLPEGVSNSYTAPRFTADDIKQFPSTSIQEVLDYIFMQTRTTQSEFDWTKYLKQSKSIMDFPFEIKVSEISIRLKGNYINGEPFKKYIVFKLI